MGWFELGVFLRKESQGGNVMGWNATATTHAIGLQVTRLDMRCHNSNRQRESKLALERPDLPPATLLGTTHFAKVFAEKRLCCIHICSHECDPPQCCFWPVTIIQVTQKAPATLAAFTFRSSNKFNYRFFLS